MFIQLLKIFIAYHSNRRLLSFCSVIITLSCGICLFLTIECILGNYKSGLIKKLLSAHPDVIIINNPKSTDEGEELDELFPDEIEEKTKLTETDFKQLRVFFSNNFSNNFCIAPIIQKDEFIVSETSQEGNIDLKTRLVALDIPKENRIFPVLDQLTEKQIEDFQRDSKEIPIIISMDIYPGAVVGDVLELNFQGIKQTCKIISILEQNKLFPVSMIIVPLKFGMKVLSNPKFSFLAIRCLGNKPPKETKLLFEKKLEKRYWVRCWIDEIPVLDSVFNTINIFLSAIIGSLFLLAFIFGLSCFDMLIRHYKTHLALLLSLGMPPATIRNTIMIISTIISATSLIIGIGLSVVILKVIPMSHLNIATKLLMIDDFSFNINSIVLLVTILMSLCVTVGSSWISSRRIFKIDPIEDLRQ